MKRYSSRVSASIGSSAASSSSTPRVRQTCIASVIGAAVALLVLLFLPPAQRSVLPVDATVRGEALEQAFAAAITKVREPHSEWSIAIDPADINAWLATRLPRWIEHDPSLASLTSLTTLRLASIDGALQIEQPLQLMVGSIIASLRFTPTIENGALALEVSTPRLGRMPIPGVASELTQALASHVRDSASLSAARFRLADGRVVEVREIRCDAGQIAILFATRTALDVAERETRPTR